MTGIGGVKDLRSGLRIEEEGDESGIMIPSYGLNFGVRVQGAAGLGSWAGELMI